MSPNYLLACVSLVVVCFTFVLQNCVRLVRNHLILSQIPHWPQHFLIGNKEVLTATKLHKLNVEMGKDLGKIAYARILHHQIVFIFDPILAAKVLDKDLSLSKNHTGGYRAVTKVSSPHGQRNLVTMDTGDIYWKIIRKGIAPAFAHKHMRRAFDVVQRCVDTLSTVLRDVGGQQYVNLDSYMMRLTIDVIGEWGFGQDLGSIKGENKLGYDVLGALSCMAGEMMHMMMNPLREYCIWDKSLGEANKAFHTFYSFQKTLLSLAKAKGVPSESDPLLVSHLLRVRDPETGGQLPDKLLEPQVGVFFFAGHDTSARTMSYTLYFLSQHPEVECHVIAELDDLGLLVTPHRPTPRQITFEDVTNLKYLQAVIKESQRLLPVVPVCGRGSADKDLEVGGYTIPKGVEIVVSIIGIHTLTWEDGEAFKPERWLDTSNPHVYDANTPIANDTPGTHAATDNPSPYGLKHATNDTAHTNPARKPEKQVKRFLPFAEGPRDCVGQSLASVTMPVTLAMLLSRFKFELDPSFDHESLDLSSITLYTKNGIPMRCKPRMG